jgi:hypothetical protein
MAEEAIEPDFSMSDLIQELEKVFGEAGVDTDDEYFTSSELCEIFNESQYRIRKALKRLDRSGMLVVGTKSIRCLGGMKKTTVPAYKIKIGEGKNVEED